MREKWKLQLCLANDEATRQFAALILGFFLFHFCFCLGDAGLWVELMGETVAGRWQVGDTQKNSDWGFSP